MHHLLFVTGSDVPTRNGWHSFLLSLLTSRYLFIDPQNRETEGGKVAWDALDRNNERHKVALDALPPSYEASVDASTRYCYLSLRRYWMQTKGTAICLYDVIACNHSVLRCVIRALLIVNSRYC